MKPRRRHTPADIRRATELREAGWSYTDIQRLLAKEEGVVVHLNTIRVWVNEDARRVHRHHDLRIKRAQRAELTGGRIGRKAPSTEFLMVRMRELTAAGLSANAVATVMVFDGLTDDLTEDEVRTALQTGRPPRRWRQEQAA